MTDPIFTTPFAKGRQLAAPIVVGHPQAAHGDYRPMRKRRIRLRKPQ